MIERDYNELIQKRIDKTLNDIILVTAIIDFFASLILLTAELPKIYGVINLIITVYLLIIRVHHDKVKTRYKIVSLVLICYFVSIISFHGGQFSSAYLIILVMGVVIAVLFLDKRQSTYFSLLSIVILFLMVLLYFFESTQPSLEDIIVVWGMKSISYVMLVFVLNISSLTIKTFLIENIISLEEAVKKTRQLAFYDTLTGLSNANNFKIEVLKRIETSKKDAFILFMTLKSLNRINATLGYHSGDKAIVEVAKFLKKIRNENVIFARTGGNEFVVWIEEMSEEGMKLKFEELFEEFRDNSKMFRNKLDFHAVYAEFNYGKDNFDEVYQRAMLALTYVKNNNIEELTPYNIELEQLFRRVEYIRDNIEKAMENGEISLVYQPQYDLCSQKVVGVEALSRWHSKDLGYVSPLEFIPILDSMNLSGKFGEFVIDRSLGDYAVLCQKYNDDIRVSINISPLYLLNSNLVMYLAQSLLKNKVPADKVVLEITEDIFIEGIDVVNKVLKTVRDISVNVSLDDFGTGYSSLNYLAQLELDEIKIDKTFTDQLETNGKADVLFTTIIKLANDLDLRIVVEGIETGEQDLILKDMGCNLVQGYYYSKPEKL